MRIQSSIHLSLFFLFLVVSTATAIGDEKIILHDGRVAVLYNNGTWKVVQDKSANSSDFRNVLWGTPRAAAISSEGKKPDYDKDNVIAFQTKVAGIDCFVAYYYVDDRLVRGRYIFQSRHTNHNDYIDDYNNAKTILEGKYGKSSSSKQVWKDDNSIWKKEPTYWGQQISSGNVAFVTSWETNTTEIYLSLSGKDFDISHIVEYYSKELQYLENSKQANEF